MQKESVTYRTESEEETLALAEKLVKDWKQGDIICLSGELGTGKTHFVKGMARGLGIDPTEVQSPTFTLINEYYGQFPLYHFDCYRLEHEREFLEIGAEEYLYDGGGISVIEWPSRVQNLLPEEAIWINLTSEGNNERVFEVEILHTKPDI